MAKSRRRGLQLALHNLPVLVKAALDGADGAAAAHPQLLADHPDEALVVGDQDDAALGSEKEMFNLIFKVYALKNIDKVKQ